MANDPVISRMFKRTHCAAYQELMNHEADARLLSHGVMLNGIQENEGTSQQKLAMYNEMHARPQGNQLASAFTGSMKKQDDPKLSLSNPDRLELLRNLRFIKEE